MGYKEVIEMFEEQEERELYAKNPINDGAQRPADDTEKFSRILECMFQTYEKKNADYGNTYRKEVERYNSFMPMTSRIYEKLERLENILLKGQAPAVNETIRETALDMANVAVCLIIEYERRNKRS